MELWLRIIDLLGSGASYPNAIARKLAISSSQAQKWLVWLANKNMVVRKPGDLRRVFYHINPDSAELRDYRRAILMEYLKKSKSWKKLTQTTRCGLYGSYAQGTFDEHSDLDVWVYGEKTNQEKIRGLANQLGEEWGRTVNIIFLDKDYLKKLKIQDPEFFFRLKLQSITDHPEVFNVA